MDAEAWGQEVAAILTCTGKRKLAAEWAVCTEMSHNKAAYLPGVFKNPQGWTGADTQLIDALRRFTDFDSLQPAAIAAAGKFGAWRCAVTDHEAVEASKLQGLAWVLKTLCRIRDDGGLPAQLVDRLAVGFGDLLTERWKRFDFTMNCDHRAWAIRSTRRYDLLPKMWRCV